MASYPRCIGIALVLVFSACGEGGGASLAPIDSRSVRVNEILELTIAINNPQGMPVDVEVDGISVDLAIALDEVLAGIGAWIDHERLGFYTADARRGEAPGPGLPRSAQGTIKR